MEFLGAIAITGLIFLIIWLAVNTPSEFHSEYEAEMRRRRLLPGKFRGYKYKGKRK